MHNHSIFSCKILFVDNLLNNKTVILLNLAEYRLIVANAAYGHVGYVSGNIARDFAGKLLNIGDIKQTSFSFGHAPI